MSAQRVVIFDSNGIGLYGAAVKNADPGYIECWIADNIAALAARGIEQCVVIEFDPNEGGDYAERRGIETHTLRLETRSTPAGVREVVGMFHADTREPQGRGHRIIYSGLQDLPTRAPKRHLGTSINALAAQYRTINPRAWGIR